MAEESLKPVERQRWFGNYDAKMLLALSSKYSPYFKERQKNKNLRKSSSADSITSQNTSRKDSQSSSSSLNNSFINGVIKNAINSGISSPRKINSIQDQQSSPINQSSFILNQVYPTTPDLLDSTENSLKQGVVLFNPSNVQTQTAHYHELNDQLLQQIQNSQIDILEDENEYQKENEEQNVKEQLGEKEKKSRNRNRNKKKLNKFKQNTMAKREEKQVHSQYEDYIYYPQYYQEQVYNNQNVVSQQMVQQEMYYENNAQYVPNYYQNLSSFELQNMLENAHTLIKDQLGCRLLQHKLDEANENEIDLIISYLIPHLAQLSVDTFGNYLAQKLIEVSNQHQLSQIVVVLKNTMIDNCLDAHGTRVVQKILLSARSPLLQEVTNIISPHIPYLAEELNGNHIIQKCLSLKFPHNQFVYDSVCKHLMTISTHKHGCCVIQKCIDCATEQQAIQIFNQVIQNAVELVQDPFGNYVIQHILDKKCLEFNNKIAVVFSQKVIELSTHKFSSNVIEKCLVLISEEIQQQMVFEITKEQYIVYLLCDQYANYVVQKAIQLCSKSLQEKILRNIRPHLENIRKSKYGKRVYTKLIKKYSELKN